MHIAVISDGITPYVTGGMQRHTFHLVRHLLLLGIDITLVHTVPHADALPADDEVKRAFGEYKGQLKVLSIPFPQLKAFPGHYVRESYGYSTAVAEALLPMLADFDFIYAKGFTAWNLLERKRRGLHTPPIGVKFHGYEMFQKTKNIRTRLEQQIFKPAVIFNSRNANVVFSYGGEITAIIKRIGVKPERIAEVTSAVDSDWIAPEISKTNEPRKFVFVGRYERRKGIRDLRAAIDELPAGLVEMHWVGAIPQRFIGKGEIRHGEIKDAAELRGILSDCDVLVAPSHAEGMPNVVLEAMARGLAIIATPVGAVSELVSNKNGRLVAPRNPTELAEAIKEFAKMPKTQLESIKRQNINDVIERFTWESVARQTLEIIQKLSFSTR